jgi:enoyl-CoA hydratase
VRVPTIAAVRGHAIGAGLNLALAADLRILGTDALFVSGFAALGLHPGGGHLAAVIRDGGPETAAAMTLFAQPLEAEPALRVGLAWEVVAVERVDARALEIARAASSDVELGRMVKQSLRMALGPPGLSLDEATGFEAAKQWWSIGRERTRERLKAAAKVAPQAR